MILDKGSSMQSNLGCFLHCTTPIVNSQFLLKSEIRNLNRLWHPWEREKVEYFTLGDLWNCYNEWSAYGAGVPIVVNNGETLVQYYVPYLSAIQIFTSNGFRDECGDSETRDSFSDSCSDESECEKQWRWDGSSSEEGDSPLPHSDRLGHLYFQYIERSAPYDRVPLMDKINGLAGRYPGLMTLRSVDLSPASWMAVAWYPIYHIPMRRTIKDLSTCFLSYHTLSSSFQDMELEDEIVGGSGERKRKDGEEMMMVVRPFGLATYKMQGDVWISHNYNYNYNYDRLVSLLSVADSWLKQLNFHHHDFNYFTHRL